MRVLCESCYSAMVGHACCCRPRKEGAHMRVAVAVRACACVSGNLSRRVRTTLLLSPLTFIHAAAQHGSPVCPPPTPTRPCAACSSSRQCALLSQLLLDLLLLLQDVADVARPRMRAAVPLAHTHSGLVPLCQLSVAAATARGWQQQAKQQGRIQHARRGSLTAAGAAAAAALLLLPLALQWCTSCTYQAGTLLLALVLVSRAAQLLLCATAPLATSRASRAPARTSRYS